MKTEHTPGDLQAVQVSVLFLILASLETHS